MSTEYQIFEKTLQELSEKNWKVKKLLADCGGYDNCPPNIKAMINVHIEKMILEKLANQDK